MGIMLNSWDLKLMQFHLNHTFDRAKVLTEYGFMVNGINLPAFHGPIVFLIQTEADLHLLFLSSIGHL